MADKAMINDRTAFFMDDRGQLWKVDLTRIELQSGPDDYEAITIRPALLLKGPKNEN